MSKFNTKQEAPKTLSYEGAELYQKNPTEDWINFIFSSFLSDRYYESEEDQTARFFDLTQKVIDDKGPEFAAKGAVFARNELGMRSAATLVAAYLNDLQFSDKRQFYAHFPHRPDDAAELFAAIEMMGQKRSHAAVRGIGDYLSQLTPYQLAKYKLKGKQYNMHDLIRITHATSQPIDDFIYEKYADIDTWERNISKEQTAEERAAEWQNLILNKQLGYLALIRNLRNILKSGITREFITNHLCGQIYNKEAIRKSLVFPYQIYIAYREITNVAPGNLINALQEAFYESVGNIPKLEGRTAIMLDVSGSMGNTLSNKSLITLKEVGAVYAAALLIQNPDSICIKFGTNAKKVQYEAPRIKFNPFTVIDDMIDNENLGYGTNVPKAFWQLNEKVDRIFLISDMQTMAINNYAWRDEEQGVASYNKYCKKYGKVDIFSFDLGNYSGQIANPGDPYVHLMTVLNDKIFKLIPYMEAGQGLKLEQLIQAIKY